MRIYATAMALACMIHLGNIATANANTTTITLLPQHPFSGGSGALTLSVPAGKRVALGEMFLHWGCNVGEKVGAISNDEYPGHNMTIYLRATTGGTFANGASLLTTTDQPNTPRGWDRLGAATNPLGYDQTSGSNSARVFVQDARGYSLSACPGGVNLWVQMRNKPADLCIDGALCSTTGTVNKLVGIAPAKGPSGHSLELTYPDQIHLENGKQVELMALRAVNGSFVRTTLTINATPAIAPFIELTDDNGNAIAMGVAKQIDGYGTVVKVAGVGVPSPGTTSGEITMTVQCV